MLKLLLASLCFALAAASFSPEFEEFIVKYNKNYSPLEKVRRSQIFERNMRQAAAMTTESAQFGVTQFSDLTLEEWRKDYLGFTPSTPEEVARSCLSKGVDTQLADEAVPSLPTSFDWRDHGAVTPVKNQGQCGSCWTFSTTGAIEGAWFLAGNKLVGLSEQEIVDCSHGCIKEPPYGTVCNQGCGGGWPFSAMQDLINMGGLDSETEYPYTAETGTCHFKKSDVVAHINNYTCLTSPSIAGGVNEEKMADFLSKNGPLSIALDATPLMSYTGGIVPGTSCSKTRLDHAVLAVGFGVENGQKYWIVKNSWGASWGLKGYFKIARGVGACGLNTAVTFPVVKK